ncbi:MAG: cache domain-containing protein, partial [Oscillospiraceae bacterium]|nr:cache domain-containing protein [Oscillospiraceae bacterium]
MEKSANKSKGGLKWKILIPSISIMLVIIALLTTLAMIDLNNAFDTDIENTKSGFDKNLIIAVESIICSLNRNQENFDSLVKDGVMTKEEADTAAYEAAKNIVRWARFSTEPGNPKHQNDGYFWADMSDGTCIAHYQHYEADIKDEANFDENGILIPRNRWDTQDRNPVDSKKTYYVREVLQNAGKFTEFYTNHPDDLDGAYLKRSYTLKYEPYGWWVST